MRLVTDSTANICWSVGAVKDLGLIFSVAVKAEFLLKHDEAAVLLPEPPQCSGDVYSDDEGGQVALIYPSDFAPFKPKADILLAGIAHAPSGGVVSQIEVGLRVGACRKTLSVSGDRFWESPLLFWSKPSPPARFNSMPVVYQRAFGGAKFKRNPVGLGFGQERLPNIESPDQPVRGRSDRPSPAGFGPIAPNWEPRRSKVGSYKGKWLKERWPWFPDDFDWSHYNAAPDDQQVQGYLRGDEELEFQNLNPKHPIYRSRLPALRARVFVQIELPGTSPEFREVKLNLDTLWADPEGEKLILVWRGLTPVRSVKFKEVTHLLAFTEPMVAPLRTNEQIRSWMQLRIAEEKGEGPPTPEEAVEKAARLAAQEEFKKDMAAMDMQQAELEKEFAALEEDIGKQMEGQEKQAIADGADPKLLEASAREPTIPEVQAELRKQAASLAEIDPESARKLESVADEIGELGRMDQEFAALGADDSLSKSGTISADLAVDKVPTGTDAGLAKPATLNSPAAALAGAGPDAAGPKGSTRLKISPGQSMREADLSNLDLTTLDLSGMDFSAANFSGTDLSGVKLVGAQLTGAKFRNANLTRADFSRAVLDGADFSEAKMPGARFTGASMQAASFSELDLSGIDFSGSKGKRADFSGSSLERANFAGAKLPQADFAGANVKAANFAESELPSADFGGCVAIGINMEKADLTNLRAGEKADYTGGNFRQAKAPKSVWETAVLDKADFSGAVLTGALFEDASLKGTRFDRAELTKANFENASAQQAVLTNANLLRASFNRANLSDASLEGSNLYEAGFWQTVFHRTEFRAANLKRTTLI